MRRHTKQIVNEYMETLRHAGETVTKVVKKSLKEDLTDALTQMQELAIQAGHTIEDDAGEGSEAVHFLEEYCETIYQVGAVYAGEAKQDTAYRLQKMLKQCHTLTEQVTASLEKENETYDVVFLPYNASMWDCMETVWRAACGDEKANVHVIPIPYYDLNDDGSYRERQYEADKLPSYVPVTSYEDYDISVRHPEVGFIHNPYDEYNHVTQVDPAFFCSKLKDEIDTLVYIPYYAYANPNARLSMEHRLLPAYLYCDYTIMQNEQMKNDVDDSIPRERILVAGSPKAERMAQMELHKEELELPDGWRERIDGKKVILYGVTINEMLGDKEKCLEKIEEVFELVKRYDNICLLWRPHPLMPATMDSMLPHLTGRYQALITRFEKEFVKTGRGILDLTGDVERSIAISDCYLGGSGSSIVELYRVIDKPRFFVDWHRYDHPTADELSSEKAWRVCRAEEDLYFVTWPSSCICKLNLISNEITEIARIPEVPGDRRIHYLDPVYHERKLYLIPARAESLCIYDLDTGVFTRKYLQAEFVENRFDKAYLVDGKIWMCPVDYPAIVCFDIAADTFTYYREGIDTFYENADHSYPNMTGWSSMLCDKTIYLTTFQSNLVLLFDTESGTSRILRIGGESNRYFGIAGDASVLWLNDMYALCVYAYDMASGGMRRYDRFPDSVTLAEPENTEAVPFIRILDMGEKLYLIAEHASHSCVLDKATGGISVAFEKMPYSEAANASGYYERFDTSAYLMAERLGETEYIAFSMYDCSFVRFDTEKGVTARIPLRIPTSLQHEIEGVTAYNIYEMAENINWPIGKYLEVLSGDLLKKRTGTWRTPYGKLIGTGKGLYDRLGFGK